MTKREDSVEHEDSVVFAQPLRVVFMGTPDFAVPSLRALCGDARCAVTLVVSQPSRPAGRGKQLRDPAVVTAARELGVAAYQPEKLETDEAFARIADERPDLIVVAAYGQILRARTLELPRYGCVNVHASLLPRWRGAAPIHWAVRAGDAVSGVSIMQMDAGLDTGPVHRMDAFMIRDHETAGTLHDALAALGARSLIAALPAIVSPDASPTPQPMARSTYAGMLQAEDRTVSFARPAREVINHINGMSPWPGVTAMIAGESVGLLFAKSFEPDDEPTDLDAATAEPGTIVFADAQRGLVVACGDRRLVRLARLKRAGKRAMDDTDCLNGFMVTPGSRITAAS